MADKPDTETAEQLTDRHQREISAIISEHNELMMHKDGIALVEVRQKCSQAIADATRRHTQEANDHSRAASTAKPAAKTSTADKADQQPPSTTRNGDRDRQ